MKVNELLSINVKGIFKHDKVLKCDIVALDGKDGKILFHTGRNKRERINIFANGEILSLWADIEVKDSSGFGCYFKPIMKCYVKHDSWLEKEVEDGRD